MKRFLIELHLCLVVVSVICAAVVFAISTFAGKPMPVKGYLIGLGLTYIVVLLLIPIAKLITRIGERFENPKE